MPNWGCILCLNLAYCCLQVAWEVQTAPESLARSDIAYDLFLLGSVMPGVKSVPSQRRLNTETYVYCFDGTNNGIRLHSMFKGVLSRIINISLNSQNKYLCHRNYK